MRSKIRCTAIEVAIAIGHRNSIEVAIIGFKPAVHSYRAKIRWHMIYPFENFSNSKGALRYPMIRPFRVLNMEDRQSRLL